MHSRNLIRTLGIALSLVVALSADIALANGQEQPLDIQVFKPSDLLVFDPPKPVCDILEQIRLIDKDLELAPISVVKPSKKSAKESTQIALGLLNEETCTRRIVTITQQGKKLIAPSGYDIVPVKRPSGIQWNVWNTQYEVNKPEGWYVIRNKYPYTPGKTDQITEIYYTPYAEELKTQTVITQAIKYMEGMDKRVDDALRTAGVQSRAHPGMPIVEVPELPRGMVGRRLVAEHTDQTEFTFGPREAIDWTHVLIGTNQDNYSVYTRSPAKAYGQQQFIEATWIMVAKAYPTARLPLDFLTGARDPFWSWMAARLLDDYNLAALREGLTDAQFSTLVADHKLLEEVLGSYYNAGPKRTLPVITTYLKDPLRYGDWINAKARTYKGYLLAETKGYIVKLRYLRDEWAQQPDVVAIAP